MWPLEQKTWGWSCGCRGKLRVSDKSEEYLFCTCCGKPGSHQQNAFVQSHVDIKGQQQACKIWKLREQKCAERAHGTPTEDVPQHARNLA